ncbi:MAG: hypothetical protein A3A33_02190 [Candidatus Yanofskybacteria bacterium RIFCSPLOWO2_01_FULL_49_25]|uniref:Uncharacterized protein n=1 Tax=Candidatus Yanofskybacteria bacterium RIFCSPLOWO2_01_FULL_49_25 TaxID=1802701 RepID=A0A1F8GRU5_9BACT|nr:MAG: hypothetical protein A3A33_02190 [Candidatus Yanofskybacteria bacterium RIFCSPLOWO2_01_FULL_49_25]
MENNNEQFMRKLLKAEQDRIIPSRALLSDILANIPTPFPAGLLRRRPFSYLRIAIPAGVVAFALILSIMGRQPRDVSTTASAQAFDAGAIQAEQQLLASTTNDMDQYFYEESSMPEINQALAAF